MLNLSESEKKKSCFVTQTDDIKKKNSDGITLLVFSKKISDEYKNF